MRGNWNSYCSLSILIFCLAGIWQVLFPGTSACSLIILQIYLWEDLPGPLSFMDIGEVSIGEYTFLRVLQDSQLVSYLSDFGRLKSESRSVVSDSLQPHGLYSSWNSPDQNTGVGSLSLLQRIFPTQGLNPSLSHCRQILYQMSHKGSPRILGLGSLSLLQRIFLTRNWTRVSCNAGRFFTYWAIREASGGNTPLPHYPRARYQATREHLDSPDAVQNILP